MSTTPLQRYAVVDIEATGGTREVDRIIEIAIVLMDDQEIHTCFSSLVHPGISIPPFISKLTGISNKMVADAPPFHMIAKKIVELTEGRYLVAHNASFDYRILREEFARLGYTYKREIIDTQRLTKTLYPDLEKYNLKALAKHFGLDQHAHHRATDDAFITAELMVSLLQKSQDTDGHIVKGMGLFARKSKLPLHVEEEQLLDIPNQCGIYYMLSGDGVPVYIGKSLKIRSRIRNHFQERGDKSDKMRKMVHRFDYRLTGSELMAEIVESQEIRKHRPLLNKAKRHPTYDYGVRVKHHDGYACLQVLNRDRIKNKEEILQWFPSRRAAKNHIRYIENMYDLKLAYQRAAMSDDPFVRDINTDEHNAQVDDILSSLYTMHEASFLLSDRAIQQDEATVFYVERGSLKAMGYVPQARSQDPSVHVELDAIDPHPELDRRVMSYIYQGKYQVLTPLD